MTKRHVVETVEEYDDNGKMTRKTITETDEEDNSKYTWNYPYPVYTPNPDALDGRPYYSQWTCNAGDTCKVAVNPSYVVSKTIE